MKSSNLMNSIVTWGPVLGLALVLSGCHGEVCGPGNGDVGSRHVVTETRPVGGFVAISISGASELIVEQAGYESLEITAEENLLPLLGSEVIDGELILGPLPGTSLSPTRPMQYRVTVVDLREVHISGASDAFIQDLRTPTLRTTVSGASRLTLSGRVDIHDVAFSGASQLLAEALETGRTTLGISGASTAEIRARNRLEGAASGVSIVDYFGHPVVDFGVSGSSLLRWAGD